MKTLRLSFDWLLFLNTLAVFFIHLLGLQLFIGNFCHWFFLEILTFYRIEHIIMVDTFLYQFPIVGQYFAIAFLFPIFPGPFVLITWGVAKAAFAISQSIAILAIILFALLPDVRSYTMEFTKLPFSFVRISWSICHFATSMRKESLFVDKAFEYRAVAIIDLCVSMLKVEELNLFNCFVWIKF